MFCDFCEEFEGKSKEKKKGFEMSDENTCDAVNVYFLSYLDERGYLYLKNDNFFAFPTTFWGGIRITEKDEGWAKCQNEPFSDFIA